MSVDFISVTYTNSSTVVAPLADAQVDPRYVARYARTLEDFGFNYTLLPYDTWSFDPLTIGATVAAHTRSIKIVIALRPNTIYPTVAAKALATLDRLSEGRVVIHLIAGGSDADQAKEGDFLPKDERYARLEEYIQILRRAWASPEAFDFEGRYYTFKGFSNSVRPVQSAIPVSLGGSSAAAYRVGGSQADIFGLWGEPLKETGQQIDNIYAEAARAGRTDRPHIWLSFRPIVAETDELAWAKADRILDLLKERRSPPAGLAAPQNAGSQRLLGLAARSDVHDDALWLAPAAVTGATAASAALVGSPETVARAILKYVDLGASLISIRGYDNLNDAIDYGRYVIPLVRQELGRQEGAATTARAGGHPDFS